MPKGRCNLSPGGGSVLFISECFVRREAPGLWQGVDELHKGEHICIEPTDCMRLEELTLLPEVQNGRYHFFNALKSSALSSSKEITAAASTSVMNWTLALCDEDRKAIYIIKYRV